MNRLGLFLCVLVWVFLNDCAVSGTGFQSRQIDLEGQTYRYQIFVPKNWTSTRLWPVILFLHGAGERGSDGELQTGVGLGAALRHHPERFPAVVVMPQCRAGLWWSDPRMERLAMSTLETAVREWSGDPDRTYLTGLSMGGYGTWFLAARFPTRFAAIVPISGGVVPPRGVPIPSESPAAGVENPYDSMAKLVAHIPSWVFHGNLDPVVPVSESQSMVRSLRLLGAPVKYKEYPRIAHNCWDLAYAEPELPTWLFSKQRQP